MNNVQMSGRPTRNPEIRYTSGQNSMAIAHLTLAVDRKYKREGEPTADFINCVAFGKPAEKMERYHVTKGTKIIVSRGRIETGSYTNNDNVKVYTTNVVIEEWEFAEAKKASEDDQDAPAGAPQKAPAQPKPRPAAEPAPTDFFSDPFAEDPFGNY